MADNTTSVFDTYPVGGLLRKVLLASHSPLMKLTADTLGCKYYTNSVNERFLEEAGDLVKSTDSSVIKSLIGHLVKFEMLLREMVDTNWLKAIFGSILQRPEDYTISVKYSGKRMDAAIDQARVLALDRLLWCKEEHLSLSHQLAYLPYTTPGPSLTSLLKYVHNWKPAVRQFSNLIDSIKKEHSDYAEAIANKGKGKEIGHGMTDDQKVQSLLELEDKTVMKDHEKNIRANFARVASSLRLLMEERPMTQKRKELAESANLRSQILTKELKDDSPTDFMRLFFICFLVSPVVLLSDINWKSVSIPRVMLGARLPLQLEEEKFVLLEKALIRMVLNLAELGGQAYTTLLVELVAYLEENGIFEAAKYDDHEYQEEFLLDKYTEHLKSSDAEKSGWHRTFRVYLGMRLGMTPEPENDLIMPDKDSNTVPNGPDTDAEVILPVPPAEGSGSAGKGRPKRETAKRTREEQEKMDKSKNEDREKPAKKRSKKNKKAKRVATAIDSIYSHEIADTRGPDERGKKMTDFIELAAWEAKGSGTKVDFTAFQVSVPRFENCADEIYANLQIIKQRLTNNPVVVNVDIISRESWESLNASERRKKLERNSVYVVGKKAQSIMPLFSGWDKSSLMHYMDVRVERSVNDHTTYVDNDHPIFRANLTTALENINSGSNAILNFLDIKLNPGRITPDYIDLEDGQVLQQTHYNEFSWATPLFTGSSAWALLSMKHAISNIHIDGGGYATFVEAVKGRKIWIMGSDPERITTLSGGFDPNDSQWFPLVINEGDQLFMRPATPHMVITAEHSLFAGGHFHSKELFNRSSYGMILCHYFGLHVSNESHHHAGTTFHRLAANYWKAMLNVKGDYSPDPDDENLPSDDQLAELAVLLFHMEDIKPSDKCSDNTELWGGANFDIDQMNARIRLEQLVEKKVETAPEFLENLKRAMLTFKDRVKACEGTLMETGEIDDDPFLEKLLSNVTIA